MMADNGRPTRENVERVIETFDWEDVPHLNEGDFGFWYDGQWSHLVCGTRRYIEVEFAGKKVIGCRDCFREL